MKRWKQRKSKSQKDSIPNKNVDEIRDTYNVAGNDMSKVLHDFVFGIEVALQNEGILDEDFNEIIK